jgi:hypothetical protein
MHPVRPRQLRTQESRRPSRAGWGGRVSKYDFLEFIIGIVFGFGMFGVFDSLWGYRSSKNKKEKGISMSDAETNQNAEDAVREPWELCETCGDELRYCYCPTRKDQKARAVLAPAPDGERYRNALQKIEQGGNTGGWDTDCELYEEIAKNALEPR